MGEPSSGASAQAPAETVLSSQLFAGRGEMAGLMRATDWSKTPLGAVEGWPQGLRTAVSICLGSRHPIVLWWGPERWMFYNDGYRPMLGERKHPQFLGRPGAECWAEIWDVIGPMMDEVIATGVATWSEDFFLLMLRYGYLEETYFTFSYSPIRDEQGRAQGIFNACAESTGRVLAERRMKTLREMSVEARSVEAALRACTETLAGNPRDVPFALIYLLDDAGTGLRLASHVGLEPNTAASPLTVDLASPPTGGWPLDAVVRDGRPCVVERLGERFDCLPKAPWDEPAREAMLLPIAQPSSERPAGVLVLGVNPRRVLDDAYRGFFQLVAGHVSTALSNARAHEEERERAEKLAELDRAKTTFFSNVSHEFRTPLTLILGPLEDALVSPSRSLRGADLEAVHRSAMRLLRLVNSLLDFARVEANRSECRFEPTDLAVLTAGLAGSFQSLVESAGLKLHVDCEASVEPIYVDRGQWEKIVLNLLSNAFKFTFEGEIRVALRAAPEHVELSVADTGTGIPEDQIEKIFERFHRVEGARGRSFEGSGIGLSLVQDLVRQHGGTIRAESIVGRGSTFVVRIPKGTDHLPKDRIGLGPGEVSAGATPFAVEAARWGAPQAEVDPAHGPSEPATQARLLVADDNADMRAYLLRLLTPRWKVEAVSDGQAALESAQQHPPDLVLSDVMMPRLDGVGLLQALRAHPATRTVPVILLSARAGEEAVVGGLETGADDYLVKPFSARELVSRVGTHLEMARLRRQATEAAVELAETRARLLEDIDRKNKELEAFSYSVSHDLRAPLRHIDGFSQALLEDVGDGLGKEGKQHLRRVRDAVQRMNQLIDDLLELSRVDQTELHRQSIDLSRLSHRVGDRLAKGAPDRAVALVVKDGLVANGDARLLEIVLENLLGNAWKFTSKASSAEVEVGSLRTEGRDAYFVRDNGAGFDAAYAARLFAPFQRLHSAADFPGTGIGLATVKRIVDRHGGRIWAEGKVGAGATIYWTLGEPGGRLHSPG